LTIRLREFKAAGWKPFGASTIGVAVNIILGFLLSVFVFGG
jgi:hypothetical protein